LNAKLEIKTMVERNELYKCKHCGNIVQVVKGGGPKVRCCGETMVLLSENTEDAAVEKHVPVVTETAEGVFVKVGEAEHPMTDEHYIEWIELESGGVILRKFLNPGEKPEAFFPGISGNVTARAYCNLHGNWKKG
jgi:superoxide reductase